MLEVGVYKGESTIQFMESGKFNRYFGVDCWTNDYYDPSPEFLRCIPESESEFDEVVKKYNNHTTVVTKLRMTSREAASLFKHEVFDFIYLDGNHNYEYIRDDIQLWWSMVKVGGYLGGHDFNMHDVNRAVTEIFGPLPMFPDSSWVIKRGPQ
jgi:hypothetical protein